MLVPALLILSLAFVLLLMFRVGGARRNLLMARWPAVLFAGAALFALARAQIWPALALGLLAAATWRLLPLVNSPPRNQADPADPADLEACAALGVTLSSSEAEIRRAHRAKMARAHPDRGGGHAEAARLNAARDRLLHRLRG